MANTATSMYFDGTNDYIQFPDNTCDLGNTNFTIEMWIWVVATETNAGLFTTNGTSTQAGFHIADTGSNTWKIVAANDGTGWNVFNDAVMGTFTVGVWEHWAFVVTADHARGFKNGELQAVVANGTESFTIDSSGARLGMWRVPGTTSYINAYIDEFRISKKSRYGNIDVNEDHTTKNYTQVAGRGQNAILPHHVKLYVAADANTAVDSTTVVDRTGNHTAGTVTNNAKYTAPTGAWPNEGTTALFFDGTDDKVSFAASPSHAVAANEDYSVEFWVNHYDDLGGLNNQYWFNQGNDFAIKSYKRSSVDQFEVLNGGTLLLEAKFGSAENVWNHVAVARVNNVHCAWVNGQLMAANTSGTGNNVAATIDGTAAIALGQYTSGTDQDCHGWLDKVRLCVGQSAYTPNFIPYGGQKNIVHNRGGAITDNRLASANSHAIRMGQAAIGSTLATNANTYCLDFDGTADYLRHSRDGDVRSTDDRGTIFAWVYPEANPSSGQMGTIFGFGGTDSSYYISFGTHGSSSPAGALTLQVNAAYPSISYLYGNAQLTHNQWNSVAVVVDGVSSTKLYVNGSELTSSWTNTTRAGGWFDTVSGGTANPATWAIGALYRDSVGHEFDGKIMQVAYFGGSVGSQGVLTAAQIAALHSAGKSHDLTTATGVYTASEIDDMHGYWQMGNHYLDTAKTIYDASGNGYDMNEVSDPAALTWSTGTTFLNNWQHRGYFTPDKYTSLLLQSSTNEGATSFQDTGPGFKRVEFDGTDDRAQKTSLTNYRSSDTVGSIVAWVKIGAAKDNNAIFCYGDTGGSADYFYLSVISDNKVNFQPVVSASSRGGSISGGSVLPGKWSMVALTYDDTQYRIYVDGVEVTTTNGLTGTPDGTETWFNDLGSGVFDAICVGALLRNSDVHEFDGQIAGVGVWSSTLTAAQISAMNDLGPGGNWKTSYSSGLVDYWTFGNQIKDDTPDIASTIFSQVSGGNDLTTSGTMAVPFAGHTITASGASMTHTTAKSVYGGSSMSFDGTDDYLQISSGFEPIGNGDFTVEAWMHCTNHNPGTGNPVIWDLRTVGSPDGTSGGFALEMIKTNGQLYVYDNVADSEVLADTASTTLTTNQWFHVAVTRQDNIMTLYMDGFPVAVSGTNTSAFTSSSVTIGRLRSGTGYNFSGFMDEFRISSGVARYSKSIERFANTFATKGDTGDAFTAFQIDVKDSKSGDQVAAYNFSGTAAAGATVTKTILWSDVKANPYGGTTPVIAPKNDLDSGTDGGKSRIAVPDNGVFNALGTEDWTYEFWWAHNKTAPSSGRSWFIAGQDDHHFGLAYNHAQTAGRLEMWFSGNGGTWDQMGESPGSGDDGGEQHSNQLIPADNAWRHIVWQRKDKRFELYIDGVLDFAILNTTAITTGSGGGVYIFSHGNETYTPYGDYFDGLRFSYKIARYGTHQLRTAQQTHISANSDSGVITSNSTFGSANNIFSTDGHTAFILTGDELYSNTHVTASGNKFLIEVGGRNVSNVTTTYAITVASGQKLDGTTGNIYYINDFGRAPLTLVRDNHYVFDISDSDYGNHPFRLATGANGPNYTTGVVVDTSGTTTQIKFSPNSDSPDSLHYYCGSHNNMGFTASVVDSTGSDGIIASQPVGARKGDGTTTSQFPLQRQGISAYGANSYSFNTAENFEIAKAAVSTNLDFGKENFTIEYWEYPLAVGLHAWSLGGNDTAAGRIFEAYYEGDSDFNLTYGTGGTASANFNVFKIELNQWQHVAIQGRWNDGKNGVIEVWKNGAFQNSTPILTNSLTTLSTMSAGTPQLSIGGLHGAQAFDGFYDSWRISKGIARYGSSGTNVKLGTNAVHHSHCKLLITSNTTHGNTLFNDTSDQGNYWNQLPFGYWIDGGNDYIISNAAVPAALRGNNSRTLIVWCDGGTISNQVLANYGNRTHGTWWGMYLTGGKVEFSAYTAGGSPSVDISGINYTPNVPQMFAFVYDDSGTVNDETGYTQYAYQDGIQVGSRQVADGTTINTSGTDADNKLVIGTSISSSNDIAYHFRGKMMQVVCLSDPLTDAAVQELWEAGPTANFTDASSISGTNYTTAMAGSIEIYYTMGNHNDLGGRPADTAAIVYDRSGNSNDAVTSGGLVTPSQGQPLVPQGGVVHSTDSSNFGSSSIFFDGTDDYLKFYNFDQYYAPGSGDWTIECWIKPSNPISVGAILEASASPSEVSVNFMIKTTSGDLAVRKPNGDWWLDSSTGAIVSDVWQHIVAQASSGETSIYVNGIRKGHIREVQDFDDTAANRTLIGHSEVGNTYLGGYLDEIAYYRGTAKYNPAVTGLGTATTTPNVLPDPTGNHFTPSGLAITDQMLDSPENNFCTLNFLKKGPDFTLSEGNLAASLGGSNKHGHCQSTFAVRTGKWYWEGKITSASPSEQAIGITGIDNISDVNTGSQLFQSAAYTTSNSYSYTVDGKKYVKNAETASWGDTFTATGSVLGVAMDFSGTTGKLDFYLNGVLQGGIGNPNGFFVNDIPLDVDYTPAISSYTGDTWHVNFGQGDPDGENNFADGNGRGGFRYEPPTGYVSLCTANMKDTDFAPIGPNSAEGTPDQHFDTVLYNGNAEDGNKIRGLNFQPDFVWIKRRASPAVEPYAFDSVRGVGKAIYTSDAAVEASNATTLKSFDPGGFTLGIHADLNTDAKTHVAWCWKAGNGTVVNTDGTIQSNISVNSDAGFSIVSYSGTGANGNVGHGLDQAPEWIIYKALEDAYSWDTYHHKAGATPHQATLKLDTNAAVRNVLHEAVTTTTIPSTHTYSGGSAAGKRVIAYCWHSVEGYSKFGSYNGNANANGPFVYLGFKPAWVMLKSSASSASWYIYDNKRDIDNYVDLAVYADLTNAEASAGSGYRLDFLSNGFKIRGSGGEINSDEIMVYMAFAEMPFKYATAR